MRFALESLGELDLLKVGQQTFQFISTVVSQTATQTPVILHEGKALVELVVGQTRALGAIKSG